MGSFNTMKLLPSSERVKSRSFSVCVQIMSFIHSIIEKNVLHTYYMSSTNQGAVNKTEQTLYFLGNSFQ